MPELSRRSARASKRDESAQSDDIKAERIETERIKAELIRADVLALAAEAEAEAAEAEAEAVRTRAALLDHPVTEVTGADDEPPVTVWEAEDDELIASDSDDASETDASETDASETDATSEADADISGRPRGTRAWAWLAATAAAAATGALIGVGAFLVWHHHEQQAVDARRAAFAEAANSGVVNLLSMDFSKGDADLQRLLDSTTGQFHDDFENSRGAFLNVLRASKATTVATIKASAVAEMGRDSALVLVAAGSEVTNTASAKQPPRAWRLAVTVRRDGDQIKMSKVEFVL